MKWNLSFLSWLNMSTEHADLQNGLICRHKIPELTHYTPLLKALRHACSLVDPSPLKEEDSYRTSLPSLLQDPRVLERSGKVSIEPVNY